jgi:hypothetical protein
VLQFVIETRAIKIGLLLATKSQPFPVPPFRSLPLRGLYSGLGAAESKGFDSTVGKFLICEFQQFVNLHGLSPLWFKVFIQLCR